jgi:hypothetical protein
VQQLCEDGCLFRLQCLLALLLARLLALLALLATLRDPERREKGRLLLAHRPHLCLLLKRQHARHLLHRLVMRRPGLSIPTPEARLPQIVIVVVIVIALLI